MKSILTSLISILTFLSCFACPNCNIHNYLNSNICNAKSIVKVQVIDKSRESSKCTFIIIDIIRGSEDLNYSIGDTIQEGYYSYVRDTGNYILLNYDLFSFMGEVVFDALDISYESEIRFLARGPERIDNKKEALEMLTGVSNYSNSLAINYIKLNYDSCYEDIKVQLESLVTKYLNGEEVLFLQHKINNLIKAIHSVSDIRNERFLIAMSKYILSNDTVFKGWENLPLNSNEIAGETLTNFIKYDQSKTIGEKLEDFYLNEITKSNSNKNIYYSYALFSFLQENSNLIKKVSDFQKDLIAYGLVEKSLSYYSFQRREIEESLIIAKKIAVNDELLMFIKKSLENNKR